MIQFHVGKAISFGLSILFGWALVKAMSIAGSWLLYVWRS